MKTEIIRISGDPLGVCKYELRLDGRLLATFYHNRPGNIPALLTNASAAYERAQGEFGFLVYDKKGMVVK